MAKKRRGKVSRDNVEALNLALVQNGKAMEEGRKIKTWSIHDIKSIKPLTPTQEDVFHAWYNNEHICLHGSAGTGKTFLALYLALEEVLQRNQQKIIIVRSAVSTREIGHLPGTLEEKIAEYEHPYQDILHELIGRASTYSDMKDAGIIEFMVTSFVRGLTWDNAIVVVDEGENMTFHEIDSIMTRLGKNSRIIFTGDIIQTDLDGKKHGVSGMADALRVFQEIDDFECVKFNKHDIVRSDFVKSWIIASEETAKLRK
jgi:phosphate starvation-inducible protein PhoH